MTQVFKALTGNFNKRMLMRRRMMEHLGVRNRPDLAEALRPHLRETLTACNRCEAPEDCATWLESGTAGAPKFCRGRLSFEALAEATSHENIDA